MNQFVVTRLDVKAFAMAAAELSGHDPVLQFDRLCRECHGASDGRQVHWSARGEMRTDAAGLPQVWLHLSASTDIPLICQRCLDAADVHLEVRRSFRFVASEEQAEVEDDLSEEDVLVAGKDFNLQELIEDELLMALPLVPRHDVCPVELKLAVQDPDFETAQQERPNPFATLAQLKNKSAD